MSSRGGRNLHPKGKTPKSRTATEGAAGKGEEIRPEGTVGRASQPEALREDVLSAVRKAVTASVPQKRSKFETPQFDLNFSLVPDNDSVGPPPAPSVFPEHEATISPAAFEASAPAASKGFLAVCSLGAVAALLMLAALYQPWPGSKSQSIASHSAAPGSAAPESASRSNTSDDETQPSARKGPTDPTGSSTVVAGTQIDLDKSEIPQPAIQPTAAVGSDTHQASDSLDLNQQDRSPQNEEPPSTLGADQPASPDATERTRVPAARTKQTIARLTEPAAQLPPEPDLNLATSTAARKLLERESLSKQTSISPALETSPNDIEQPEDPAASKRALTDEERASATIASAMENDPLFVAGDVAPARIKQARDAYGRAARLAGLKFPPIVAILEKKSVAAARGVSSQLLSEARTLVNAGQVQEARSMMTMLAHANIPEVSFAIARSYDPTYLSTLPEHNAKPSVEQASDWYRRWHNDSVASGQVSGGAYVERLIQSMQLHE